VRRAEDRLRWKREFREGVHSQDAGAVDRKADFAVFFEHHDVVPA
jgi:hypothetical protein